MENITKREVTREQAVDAIFCGIPVMLEYENEDGEKRQLRYKTLWGIPMVIGQCAMWTMHPNGPDDPPDPNDKWFILE